MRLGEPREEHPGTVDFDELLAALYDEGGVLDDIEAGDDMARVEKALAGWAGGEPDLLEHLTDVELDARDRVLARRALADVVGQGEQADPAAILDTWGRAVRLTCRIMPHHTRAACAARRALVAAKTDGEASQRLALLRIAQDESVRQLSTAIEQRDDDATVARAATAVRELAAPTDDVAWTWGDVHAAEQRAEAVSAWDAARSEEEIVVAWVRLRSLDPPVMPGPGDGAKARRAKVQWGDLLRRRDDAAHRRTSH